jgi:hypothetical protein
MWTRFEGFNPANLPVDEPVRYDLVINLKAAHDWGSGSAQCAGGGGRSSDDSAEY